MKSLTEFKLESPIQFVFSDIDDTLTNSGKLGPESYQSLWDLSQAGVKVIPITGRPAGWCEMIARFWPVDGVVRENGVFYFRYKNGKMERHFSDLKFNAVENQKKLAQIKDEILKEVPGSAVASDQFCRIADLAIDFCEDVPPLPKSQVDKIVHIFERHGATAKVSSIHVNGWFGNFDKLSCTKTYMKNEFGIDLNSQQSTCLFVGDSPNDEPMFKFFKNSFGVANIREFSDRLKHPPKFVSNFEGGLGFQEICQRISK
ncbi:MAG: HAD-IIB family hydrolase [Bdellovibrionales bacterium]|nr:HAD-IIB family hydrolase [Bdellovibrionales bacterium]